MPKSCTNSTTHTPLHTFEYICIHLYSLGAVIQTNLTLTGHCPSFLCQFLYQPGPIPSCEPHLGSRFFLTRVTNVSISAAVICFSSSLRLLWSRAVIVSSASTSYPICFCMKRNCLAMYSYKEKEREDNYYKEKRPYNVRGHRGTVVSTHLILPVILLRVA